MTAKLYLGGFHIYPTPPPRRWVKTRFICVVHSKLPALWAQLGTWRKKIKLLFFAKCYTLSPATKITEWESASRPGRERRPAELFCFEVGAGRAGKRWTSVSQKQVYPGPCDEGGADLRFHPWLCHLTSCGSSDKSLLSASQDFSVIRQTAYVTLISMVLFQLRFSRGRFCTFTLTPYF